MTVTNLLLQSIPSSANNTASASVLPQSGNGSKTENFDDFLTRPDRSGKSIRERIQPLRRESRITKSRIEIPRPVVPVETESRSENIQTDQTGQVVESVEIQANDKQDGRAEVKAVGNVQDNELEQEQDAYSVNDKIIISFSEKLGIPEEQLLQILAAMNIEPIQLAEPENLSGFIMKITGVDEAAELLSMDDVKEMYVAVDAVLNEFSGKVVNTATDIKSDFGKKIADMKSGTTEEPVTESAVLPEQTLTVSAETQYSGKGRQEEFSGEEPPEYTVQPVKKDTVSVQQPDVEIKTELQSAESTPKQIYDQNPEFNPMASAPTELRTHRSDIHAEAVKNINTQDVIEQIVSKIKVEIKTDVSEVRIHLKPEHLGEVSMKITTLNGLVTAQFIAENQRVKETIESGFTDLRDTLNQQGVSIQELSVSVGNGNAGETSGSMRNGFNNNASAARLSGDGDMVEPELVPISVRSLDNSTVEYKA